MILQARLERFTDIKSDVLRRVAVNLEIFAVGKVTGAHGISLRIEADISVLVQYNDRTQPGRRRGPVEQDFLTQPRLLVKDVGIVHTIKHGLKRERVEFNVACDGLLRERGHVGGGLLAHPQRAPIEIVADGQKETEQDQKDACRGRPDECPAGTDQF